MYECSKQHWWCAMFLLLFMYFQVSARDLMGAVLALLIPINF